LLPDRHNGKKACRTRAFAVPQAKATRSERAKNLTLRQAVNNMATEGTFDGALSRVAREIFLSAVTSACDDAYAPWPCRIPSIDSKR
jgi:hypothetical protein